MDLQFQFKSQCTYQFKKHLGSGASAEVLLYSRETKGLPAQDVVLKILKDHDDESAVRELINDGAALSRLKHPNILSTFGYEKINSSKFGLLLEYFPGTSLNRLIPRISPSLRHDAACFLVPTIIKALAAAHGQGIIHGDISGRNVLVSEHGQIKLADFGLATLRSGQDDYNSESCKGSLDYFAPERWDGWPSSEAADIFSVGILALEILSGGNELQSVRPRDGKRQLLEFLSGRPWECFPQWEPFFHRALSSSPEGRFSASELLETVPLSALTATEAQNIIGEVLINRRTDRLTEAYDLLPKKTVCLNPGKKGMGSSLLLLSSRILAVVMFGYGLPVPCEVSSVGNVRPLMLTMTSRPWGSVFIDGQFKGYTPLVRQTLPAGYHEIVWRGPAGDEIKRSLQAYKFKHIHYKIFLEKNGPLSNKGPIMVY